MNTKRRKTGFRKWMLLLIFSVVTVFACVATACGEKGHSHEWVEHAATDSTCTVAGHELYYTCRGCEMIFDAQKNEISAIPEKPLLEHVWGEGVKTADPTCTHGEEFTYTCSVGGETKKEYVGEALGHVWGEYEVTDRDLIPDCENDGTQTAVCTRCHDAYNTISKPALGHSYGELIERQDAQRGTLGSPCQTGVEAHYFCNVCKYYLDADKKRTTLDALTIDLHKDDGNLQWKFTDTYHEHVCQFCGETIKEGDHSFEDWSTFTCSICKQNVEKRFVYAFDDINDYCRSNWEPVPDYKAEIATLPQGATLPDGIINSGDNALCFTANRNKGEGKYQIWPALYIGGLKDIIASAENSYRFTIWIYSTAAAKSGIDNWFVFGNATLNEDGSYFDSDISSQSPMNKNSFEPNFTANGWYSFTMTVADIKAACTKQGRVEAEWIHFSCEATENMKLYFYATYLYPEQSYSIEKSNDIHTYVKGNETSSILPLSTVRVEAVGLEFGKGLKVVDDNGNQIAIIYGSTGSFVMPYSNVEISEIDVLNVPLETLNMPLFSGNVSLPKTHDSFYDSYTVAFKKNGQPLDASKFTYDEKTHIVTFTESGTYTVEYSLTYGGISKNLTRTATVGVVNGIDSIADECTPWFAPGETADWNQSMVTIAEAGITKPESAVDVGDNLLKCTVQKQQYVAPVFALGDFLEHLSELNDSDYLRIWVYYTGTWSGGSIFHEWNFWGTGNPSRLVNNVSLLPQELGKANTWVGLDFTVAAIKAQLEKQNQTYNNFDGFKSNAYLYTMISLSNPCDIYFYSVEFHKETAREIDASSVQGVTVQEKAIPLNTVEVDASGLEYGKVVEIVNAETGEVIATINGTGSFVMPYAKVKLTVTDIFKKPLDDLQLPLYEGIAALPELYNGLYDSYTLTVKQNGAEVLGGKYTFDTATETITFNEPGVYELTYTLTYGDNSKKLTCTATVGVLTEYSNANVPNYVDYCSNQLWGKGDAAAAKQLNDVSLNKPSSAIDVDSNTVLQYTTTGNQVAHALKVSYLTDILTNGSDNDYISIWLYRTGAAVSDQNFWMIGNAEDPYEWEGKMYVNYNADSTDGQKVWVNGENKSATYSEEYAQYVGDEWFELKFTVKELKDQLNKQGADLETMQPQWILLSFGLSSATDSVSYYSIEYHKA